LSGERGGYLHREGIGYRMGVWKIVGNPIIKMILFRISTK
jgi:hypothetical protein